MALGSWRSWMPSSGIWQNTTLVKVEASTGTGAVPCTTKREKFPVLVRVMAAEESSTPRHVGVDIVAVLDISGSMFGEKLEHTKDAMKILIDKLGRNDRLAIVSFESNVYRLTELTYMSDQGRSAAQHEINELFTKGGTNMGPALHEGAQVLRGRRDDEKSSRVGCIVFLSDGLDNGIYTAAISPDFPAHTFGLGTDHDPRAMKHIADKTSGTYSFVNNDVKKIKDAFTLFIAGLTSVTATAVEITLRARDGVVISAIESGGYAKSSDDRSGAIRVDNMYAGEKKNFMVYLKLEETEEGKQKLLTVGGRYRSLGASKQLADTDIFLMRPLKKHGKAMQQAAPDDVTAEAARIKLVKEVSSLVPLPQLPPTNSAGLQQPPNSSAELQQLWDKFSGSEEGKAAPKDVMEKFKKDCDEMMSGISSISTSNSYQVQGLPYMLSWLTSHKWQRATTKNEPDSPKTGDFLTPGQQRLVDGEKGGAAAAGTVNTNSSSTTAWEKLRAQARSHPCSCLLPGVAVALVLAWLFVMMLYSALQGSSMARNIAPLQYPMLSKSNYAAWAIKMEVYMRAQGVWDAIETKDPKKVSTRKNQMALAAIYQAIPEGTLFLLSGKKTAKSAWEALKSMHIGAEGLRDAKLQTLKLEFEGLRMKETESVDDFAVQLTTIVNKIQSLGENIEEAYTVKKFLRAVPSRFLQIASTIEQFGDLKTMTIEELIGRLKAHEERLGGLGGAEEENVLLTHAEWKARDVADEISSSRRRGCCGDDDIVDASKVIASAAKIVLGKCRECPGCDRDTYRVRASVAKVLDIMLASVVRKEKEVKAHLVEARCDDEVALLF